MDGLAVEGKMTAHAALLDFGLDDFAPRRGRRKREEQACGYGWARPRRGCEKLAATPIKLRKI